MPYDKMNDGIKIVKGMTLQVCPKAVPKWKGASGVVEKVLDYQVKLRLLEDVPNYRAGQAVYVSNSSLVRPKKGALLDYLRSLVSVSGE